MPEGQGAEQYITDEHLYEALQFRLNQWNFSDHSEQDNAYFAHNISHCVVDVFDYLTYAGSENFAGSELPASLLPLVSHQWTHSRGKVVETVFEQDMRVKIYKRENHVEISPRIPGFEKMIDSGMTFDQTVEALANDPEALASIIPGEIIVDSGIVIRLSKEYSLPWGLEFMVNSDRIELAVFGREQETRKASQYLVTYHNKPRVLAETAAHLAILGAKHCMRRQNYATPDLHISRLDKQFFGDVL